MVPGQLDQRRVVGGPDTAAVGRDEHLAREALRRLHGHTYTLRLHLSAPLDALMGWTIDFGDVKSLFEPIFLQLDHRPLHQIADLADGDSASVARWIFERARGQLPQLDRVDLLETEGCGAMVIAPGAGMALSV